MPGKITSAVVILLAMATIVGAGAWLAARHYQPAIDSLNESLTQCRYTGRQQAATITSQNAGIEALQRADAEREAKAKSEQEKARRVAHSDYGKATAVLSERTSGEACAAAPFYVEVKVPIAVSCKNADIAPPAFAVDQLPISAPIDTQMRALRAERHQRIGYERELIAANEACK